MAYNPTEHSKGYNRFISFGSYVIVGVIGLAILLVILAITIPLLIGLGYLLVWSIPLLIAVVLVIVIWKLL